MRNLHKINFIMYYYKTDSLWAEWFGANIEKAGYSICLKSLCSREIIQHIHQPLMSEELCDHVVAVISSDFLK